MIAALYEGTYAVGLDGRFNPIQSSESPKRGTIKLAVNPFLIKQDSFTALIDAGLGPFGPHDHHAMMMSNLALHNVDPPEIQHVYCSHLHTDHIGGLLHERFGTFDLTFPNATIWLSGRDWKQFVQRADEKQREETLRWAHYLETYGELRFVEETSPEPKSITMETIGGHTEFHQAILYEGNGEKAMMLGDVLGRVSAINHNFKAKFDFDGPKSQKMRDHYLQKAWQEGYFILTYHSSKGAIASLVDYDTNKGYNIDQIEHHDSGTHT